MTKFEEKNSDVESNIVHLRYHLQEVKKVENSIELHIKKIGKELENFESEMIFITGNNEE